MSAGQACKLMRFSLIGMLTVFFVGFLFSEIQALVILCVFLEVVLGICFLFGRFSWKCPSCGVLLPARGSWMWITRCPCCGESLEDMGG